MNGIPESDWKLLRKLRDRDRQFDLITLHSAAGSTVGTEYAPGIMDFDADKVRDMSAPLREHGLDIDMPALVYAGRRSHVMEYLGQKGWQVQGSPRAKLFSTYGLPAATVEDDDPLGEIVYVAATLPG